MTGKIPSLKNNRRPKTYLSEMGFQAKRQWNSKQRNISFVKYKKEKISTALY